MVLCLRPFAMAKGDGLSFPRWSLALTDMAPPDYLRQAEELIAISANLTDRQKTIFRILVGRTAHSAASRTIGCSFAENRLSAAIAPLPSTTNVKMFFCAE